MKSVWRPGIFRILCLVVALSLASQMNALSQPAEVRLRQTSGCSFPDDINSLDMKNWQRGYMRFAIQARSLSLQSDVSIGFTVYSPDGSAPNATISNLSLSPDWQSPTTYWAPSGAQLTLADIDGTLPDTWLVTAVATAGGGFQALDFVDVLTFNLTLPDIDGAIVCIDSAFVPPAGQWLMNPDGPPSWQGGGGDINVGGARTDAFCITVLVGALGPVYSTCVDSVATSYCSPVTYQVVASDPDPTNAPVFYHTAHDGAGTASVDTDGNVTYTPAIQDTNSVVTVTTFAQLPWTCDEGTTCRTKIAVTYDSPQAVCSPNILMLAGDVVNFPPALVIDLDSCETYLWSLVSVNPIPLGLVTVDPTTGVITYASDRLDVTAMSIEITIKVSDGLHEDFCTTSASFHGTIAACCDAPGDADNSGQMNIADVTFLIARIFTGGPPPVCCAKADANADNSVNITDVTFLIARIFSGGPPPSCSSGGFSCGS